jgi:two-component system sensor histidine kinase MtrB
MLGVGLVDPDALPGFILALVVGVVGAVVLCVLVASRYAGRLTEPLTRLVRRFDRMGDGVSYESVPVEGPLELAALARSFNSLVHRLQVAEAARQRADESRRDLIANLSHDIRMPLTSLWGFAEALADDEDPGPEARRRYGRIIGQRARELSVLLDDLMELSRLQTTPPADLVPRHLPEVVRQAVIPYADEVQESGRDLVIDIADDLPPVVLDVGLLTRAIENLLRNALTHAVGATWFTVRVALVDGEALVSVEDDGPGIPDAVRSQLFDRYYRGSSRTAVHAGSGLGLAIVREIAHLHGGEVRAQNRPEGGSVFTLRLPVVGRPAGADGRQRASVDDA